MDAESLWLCQTGDAGKQIHPWEGVLKVKSWVLFTHCYQVCVKLLLHCSIQIKPRAGSKEGAERALPVPSTSCSEMGQGWDNVHVNPTRRWWNAEQTLTAAFLSLGLSCLWPVPLLGAGMWGKIYPTVLLKPCWALSGSLNVQCVGKGSDLVQNHRKFSSICKQKRVITSVVIQMVAVIFYVKTSSLRQQGVLGSSKPSLTMRNINCSSVL